MKFKNIKKEAKKAKLPSNSRTISSSVDRFTTFIKIYRLSLKIFIVLIFLLAVVIVGLDLQANTLAKQAIDLERKDLTKDLKFWEHFITEHEDYKDAYFQASILEYKLGNTSKAKMYVEKGLLLDPNSQDGRKVEKVLNK